MVSVGEPAGTVAPGTVAAGFAGAEGAASWRARAEGGAAREGAGEGAEEAAGGREGWVGEAAGAAAEDIGSSSCFARYPAAGEPVGGSRDMHLGVFHRSRRLETAQKQTRDGMLADDQVSASDGGSVHIHAPATQNRGLSSAQRQPRM